MLIEVEHTFVRPPNSDIIEDGSWCWGACWHNPLNPESWDENDYASVYADSPWTALAKLMQKLESLFG